MKNEVKYFNRFIDKHLTEWKNDDNHKPILLRGSRQVGKSSTVKNLAKQFDYIQYLCFRFLLLNFWKQTEMKDS